MKLRYTCSYWGSEHLSAQEFLDKVLAHGYEGVEINLPDDERFAAEFTAGLSRIRAERDPGFLFIAQQVLPPARESAEAYQNRMKARLEFLCSLRPDAINSHTGKDFFEWDENLAIIDAAESISMSEGIPIWHETHRGRFSFHAKSLLAYLKHFPHLKLVGDLSHFCVVSESLLDEQEAILRQIFPHIHHLHARVGSGQAPQVNHPFAPEWETERCRFIAWWKEILDLQKKRNQPKFSLTPEAGPFPYLPQEPFSQKPYYDPFEMNHLLKNHLIAEWKPEF